MPSSSGGLNISMRFLALIEDTPVTQLGPSGLAKLEAYLDRLWRAVGLGLAMSTHWKERLADARNRTPIGVQEIIHLFQQEITKHGKQLRHLQPGVQGVFKDTRNDLNVPFVLDVDRRDRRLKIIAKTIIKKRNFHTPSQTWVV